VRDFSSQPKSLDQIQPVGVVLEKRALESSDSGLALYRNELTRDIVMRFFNEITRSEEITRVVCEKADKYSVPLTFAFALCGVESRFNIDAVNKNTSSEDKGLFQLNNMAWPELTDEDFFSLERNADHGMKYLRYCLDRGENEVVALAMYNAGEGRVSINGTPVSTLNYIYKILSYRDELDGRFKTSVMNALQTL